MSNIFTPENLGKYESMVVESALMMKNKGLIEMSQLYAKYLDVLEEVIDDKVKAGNFLNRVWSECGKPPKLTGSEILEPFSEFRITNLGKLRPYHVRILSCKRVFTKNYRNEIEEKIIGFLELNGERFKYTAPYELPLDELVVWAIPSPEEKKNDMIQITFEVWGYQEVYGDYGLTTIQILDEEFRDLKSIRECFVKVVGEDMNIAVSILALVSRLNKIRDFWIMGIIVQGQSSAGKSYLMSNILKPWSLLGKVEEFTRFTGAYLERKFSNLNKNLDDMIFAIYELFSNTPQQLHLTLSEGKLRVGLVDKETGEPIEFVFEGMPFMFSTTPMEGIRTDLKNRIINISIDESEEQTKRIIDFETRLGEDPEFAETIQKMDELNMRRFAKFLDGLEKNYVLVPYAQELKKALILSLDRNEKSGQDWNVKLRRDWKKLISLLHASALLFQKYRPKTTLSNGEKVIVATEEDFENLLYIMPAFEETLISLPKRCQRLLKIMTEEGQSEYTVRDLVILANKKGWRIGDRWIRDILSELAAEGIVAKDETGRAHKYQVVNQPGKIEFDKVKLPVLKRLMEFYKNRGMEPEYSELIRKYPEIQEKPVSKPQNQEISEEPELEVETQSMEPNSIIKGLGESLESSIPLPVDNENHDSKAQNQEKQENNKTSNSLPRLPDQAFINSPLGSPQAGESGKEVDA